MTKILAYLRTSTDKQDLRNQKLEILEYAREKRLHVDEFIQLTSSSRKDRRQRRIENVMEILTAGDILIVTELSASDVARVITLINELLTFQIRVIVIKQNLDLHHRQEMTAKVMITLFSLFAELERDLISLRTKEALAAKKAQGIQLGKPKGTVQTSVYDKDRSRIVELLRLGLSARKIAEQHLTYSHPSSLSYYINTRKLRADAQKNSTNK